MSIVEKAVEKLKIAHPDEPATLRSEPGFEPVVLQASAASTIERLRDRTRITHGPAVEVPPWHVNMADLKRAGILPEDEKVAFRLAHELRHVKRPVIANVTGQGSKRVENSHLIMVASALPGEGKTFTALNLALSLAKEIDFEVLLVDADVPKSDVTRILKLESREGLMDVLLDETRQPAEVILHTDVPNLSVVPVGKRSSLTAELFGSARMDYVLREFLGPGRRRLVLFDSSPLLATADAQTLATYMGQVILVVAAGRTERQTVESALQTLGDSRCVGLVLNMSRLPGRENYYYGYYPSHVADH